MEYLLTVARQLDIRSNYLSIPNQNENPSKRDTTFARLPRFSCSAMASSVVKETLGTLNKDSYVNLLSKLIGESRYVQNNPPELIPQEDRVVKHVLDALLPLSTKTGGGPLVINHVTYFTGRGNIIVEYPGTEPGKILSFVGMHMDVVTANPNEWVCLSFLMLLFELNWVYKFRFWHYDGLTLIYMSHK